MPRELALDGGFFLIGVAEPLLPAGLVERPGVAAQEAVRPLGERVAVQERLEGGAVPRFQEMHELVHDHGPHHPVRHALEAVGEADRPREGRARAPALVLPRGPRDRARTGAPFQVVGRDLPRERDEVLVTAGAGRVGLHLRPVPPQQTLDRLPLLGGAVGGRDRDDEATVTQTDLDAAPALRRAAHPDLLPARPAGVDAVRGRDGGGATGHGAQPVTWGTD